MPKSLRKALIDCSCPRCREGNMFLTVATKKWFDREMHEKCSVCDQTFEPEPGFYYGAMFVSYAFSVAITFSSIFVLYVFFGDPDFWVYLAVITGAVLLLWPLMFRYSRSIFLHLFGGIRFDSTRRDS